MHRPSLSLSFCDKHGSRAPRNIERKLLLCAVIDDARELETSKNVGGFFRCDAESEFVRHVGDAIVVGRSDRVMPMFVATLTAREPSRDKAAREAWRPWRPYTLSTTRRQL